MRDSVRHGFWAVVIVLALTITVSAVPAAGLRGEEGGFIWTRQFGIGGDGRGVAADASGVYVVGRTAVPLPDQTIAGSFLRMYNREGVEVWTKQWGLGTVNGVAVYASSVYVVAWARVESHGGSADPFVWKFDITGFELWNRSFDTEFEDLAYGIAADASGVYVVGMTTGPLAKNVSGSSDAFVRKYDPSGTEMWTRQFGSSMDDWAFDVDVDAQGVYVAGETRDVHGGADAFVSRYDHDGNEVWIRQFGGRGENRAWSVAVHPSGIYVAGERNNDGFVRKYDMEGGQAWDRRIATEAWEYARGVDVDGHGVYVVGQTTGTLAGETNANGDSDPYLRKYDLEGMEKWTVQFGSPVSADIGFAIALDASGVYIAGYTSGVMIPGGIGGVFVLRAAETPGPPADVRATAGNGEAFLAWGPPPFDGGQPVDWYAIYRGENSRALSLIAVVDGANRYFTDATVENNVTYFYSFAARNQIGEGPWSDLVQATPRAPPLLLIITPREVLTNDPNVVIEGRTEVDATVEISGQNIPVGADGAFRWSATLPDGSHEFLIVARNPIGLESSAIVTITVDTRTPLLLLLGLGAIAVVGGAVLFAGFRRWTRRAK